MEFRSTNDNGYVHFQGDVVSNVSSGQGINSSHGVQLTGGSTGGVVTAAGDETNIALNLRAKGSGPLNLGSTGSGLVFNSSATQFGSASTSPFAMIQRYRVDFSVPALSSNSAAASTYTVTGLTTNSILVFSPRLQNNSSVAGIFCEARCSTADELTLTIFNGSVSSVTGSTQSAYLLQFKV